MTTKSKMMTVLAAGLFASSVAAHAHNAMAPDPNLGLTTSGEEALVPHTAPNSPQLAVAPDTNVGPSTASVEAEIPASSPNSPQLALAPDPNFGRSGTYEKPEMQAAAQASSASSSMQTIDE